MDKRLYPQVGLHGQVAHHIGRRIVSGEIAEGAFLPRETELSEEFAVSRQAIREGLKVLAAKGLVTSRRRAGTSVSPRKSWNLLDPDVIAWHGEMPTGFHRELFEMRRLIEPAAAAYAAIRGKPEEVARIGVALDAMRATVGDPQPSRRAMSNSTRQSSRPAGNSLIERFNIILGPLLAASYRALEPPFPIEDYHGGVARLVPVYDAIRARDPLKAQEAMEKALSEASDYVASWPARRIALMNQQDEAEFRSAEG